MLSCLELSEEETEQYAKEFNTILEHFEVLKTTELGEEVEEQSIHLPGEGREDERKHHRFLPRFQSLP